MSSVTNPNQKIVKDESFILFTHFCDHLPCTIVLKLVEHPHKSNSTYLVNDSGWDWAKKRDRNSGTIALLRMRNDNRMEMEREGHRAIEVEML